MIREEILQFYYFWITSYTTSSVTFEGHEADFLSGGLISKSPQA